MAYRAEGPRSSSSPETDASPRTGVSARRSTSRTQDIDRHVGARIRERRIMLGLTQQQLADLIGVTYQQAHKYERGINRVSAGACLRWPRCSAFQLATFSTASNRVASAGSVLVNVCALSSPATSLRSRTNGTKRL